MKQFNVPPVVFPSGANPATVASSLQHRRFPPTPFQPPKPAIPSIPFVSFDIGSGASTSVPYNPPYGGDPTASFSDEPSLLEELEIDPSLIYHKTLSLLNPVRVDSAIHDSPDLSGPFLYYILFSLFQILAGKVQFGVILGYFVVFSISLYVIFNLLEGKTGNLDLYRCFSFVGYGLLPVVIYSAVSLFLPPLGAPNYALAVILALWSTRICASLVVDGASGGGYAQFGLIAYPCFLIYMLFSMLVVF